MRRSLGFQQQCYADDGTWMSSQTQQQSYAVHEESWSSDNHFHHNQLPGMRNKPGGAFAMVVESELSKSKQHGKLGGIGHGMFQGSRHSVLHDNFEEGDWNQHRHGHVLGNGKKFPFGASNGGGANFNAGGSHGYFSEEEAEHEAHSEARHSHHEATVKVDEMRYERHHNWGGVGFYANENSKWVAKGV